MYSVCTVSVDNETLGVSEQDYVHILGPLAGVNRDCIRGVSSQSV